MLARTYPMRIFVVTVENYLIRVLPLKIHNLFIKEHL